MKKNQIVKEFIKLGKYTVMSIYDYKGLPKLDIRVMVPTESNSTGWTKQGSRLSLEDICQLKKHLPKIMKHMEELVKSHSMDNR